jgi:hypothetical protein
MLGSEAPLRPLASVGWNKVCKTTNCFVQVSATLPKTAKTSRDFRDKMALMAGTFVL